MKKRLNGICLAAVSLLCMLSLAACGGARGENGGQKEDQAPAQETAPESEESGAPAQEAQSSSAEAQTQEKPDDGYVHVSNVEEFLKAIKPGAKLKLEPGVYNLYQYFGESEEGVYEKGEYYQATPLYTQGADLEITGVQDLVISGSEEGEVELVTEAYDADVLRFDLCSNITLENLKLGHLVEPGECSGNVLEFYRSHGITLKNLDLYGSGAEGISMDRVDGLKAEDCVIRECTWRFLSAWSCNDLQFLNCAFKDTLGELAMIDPYLSMISFENCSFTGNSGTSLWPHNEQPDVSGALLSFSGCSFGKWETESFKTLYPDSPWVSFDETCSFTGEAPEGPAKVNSVRELLEAIRPGARILLETGKYNLSEYMDKLSEKERESFNAAHPYVQIMDAYDGMQAEITDCVGLTIEGGSGFAPDTELLLESRYGSVLTLKNSSGICLKNMTMGHTQGGECSGNVIDIAQTTGVVLQNMDLYGCGVDGLFIYDQSGAVTCYNTIIRDCQDGPISVYDLSYPCQLYGCTLTGSERGGYFPAETENPVYFYRCSFGEAESNTINFAEGVYTEDCEWSAITQNQEYPDIEEEYDEPEGPFDVETQ